jgi:hypothetical protein
VTITHQVFIEPAALAVGLAEEHLVLCIEVFGRAGLKVHRADPEEARERLGKVLPHIVVVAAELEREHREAIDDRAVAVGALVVELNRDHDLVTIERILEEAVATARKQRGRKPRTA